jgi:hypothetical protein
MMMMIMITILIPILTIVNTNKFVRRLGIWRRFDGRRGSRRAERNSRPSSWCPSGVCRVLAVSSRASPGLFYYCIVLLLSVLLLSVLLLSVLLLHTTVSARASPGLFYYCIVLLLSVLLLHTTVSSRASPGLFYYCIVLLLSVLLLHSFTTVCFTTAYYCLF